MVRRGEHHSPARRRHLRLETGSTIRSAPECPRSAVGAASRPIKLAWRLASVTAALGWRPPARKAAPRTRPACNLSPSPLLSSC